MSDLSGTWTDISSYVKSLSFRYGRQNELNRTEAGTGAISLHDPQSKFDPRNTGSPYYPNVKPRRPIRARALLGGTYYPLFQHYVERWPRASRLASVYTERSVETVDVFKLLALPSLASKTYSSQLSKDRVAAVLTDAGWSTTRRTFNGSGQTTVGSATFAADDSTTALDHIFAVTSTEDGLFFIGRDGYTVFDDRWQLINTAAPAVATFVDDPDSGGTPYASLIPSNEDDLLYNEWIGTRSGGTPQNASDATSITAYGRSTNTFTSLAAADGDVLSAAQFKLSVYKDPIQRIQSLTLRPGDSTSFWQTLLGSSFDLGAKVTIKEKPPGFTSTLTADYIIQSISVEIPTGTVNQATWTLGVWPATTNPWLILDDANLGLLDTGVLAY